MAKQIKIDTDRLNGDLNSIREKIDNIRGWLRNIEEQAAVLDGMWTGPGSEAFKAAFHSDIRALSTIISNLDDLNKYEDKACGRFRRCENKVREAVEELRV